METSERNAFAIGSPASEAFGLEPLGTRVIAVPRHANAHAHDLRRAAVTLVLALYPLVGSVTIVLAAIMLASGANAG